jgi:hypothetical protein
MTVRNFYAGMDAVTMNSLPSPLRARILPPCAVTIALATDRPMPCPPAAEFLDLSVL